MKKVFSSREVAHIFAKQTQDAGHNSNNTIFFEGQRLYSYSHNFCLANIIKPDTVLFNSRSYSVTTSKHQSWTMYALNHVPTRYFFPYPERPELNDNFNWYVDLFRKSLDLHSRARSDKYLPELYNAVKHLEFLIDWTKEKKPLTNFTHDFRADLKDMKKTLKTLEKNPDQILNAIKAQYKEEQARKKRIKEERKLENLKDIQRWIAGEISYLSAEEPYLRLTKDSKQVETSKGVNVSIKSAKSLWALIKAKKDVKGYDIEGYKVISLNGTLKIGCHAFELAEVERFGSVLDNMGVI